MTILNPKRKEIWLVDFDPRRGAEIAKTRPAVVISVSEVGHLPLRMVVPVTEWKKEFFDYLWFVRISPSETNGLKKESGADSFQCKSFSLDRFVKKLGSISEEQINEIVKAVGLCIGLPEQEEPPG